MLNILGHGGKDWLTIPVYLSVMNRWGRHLRFPFLAAALAASCGACTDPDRLASLLNEPSCRLAVTKDGMRLRICETATRVTVEETGPASRAEIQAYFRLTGAADRRGDAALAAPPAALSRAAAAAYDGPAR
jgi:hypothetical protein